MYTATGEDYANEIESQDIAKLRARDKAIKNATKQAGVYLKSYSRSVNSELTDDEILAITSNAWQLVGEPKYSRTVKQISDTTTIILWTATVEVNVDDAEIQSWIKRGDENKLTIISQTNEALKSSEENDKKIAELFTLMDKYHVEEKQGIFFQGQIFDAYAKFESFLSQAKKEIVLIDSYVDLSILERLAKKKKGVNVIIYTDPKTKLTTQDVQKFNSQYPTLTVNHTTKIHDRFLIVDGRTLYHIGASLKDLGKKCFAFELMEDSTVLIPLILKNL